MAVNFMAMCRKSELPPNYTTGLAKTFKCVVCGHVCHGCHFGVRTCRACAAFFRRAVASQKTFQCRAQKSCEISKEMRNMCRFCRFKKCKQLGMKPYEAQLYQVTEESSRSSVDSNRTIQKRPNVDPVNGTFPPVSLRRLAMALTAKSRTSLPVLNGIGLCPASRRFALESVSMLDRLRQGYLSYESSMQSLFTEMHPDMKFSKNAYKKVTHTEIVQMERGIIPLMLNMLKDHCQPFDRLPRDVQLRVFRDFNLKFGLLAAAFKNSHTIPGIDQSTQWIGHSNELVDDNDLDYFFKDDVRAQETAKLFKRDTDMMKAIRDKMVKLKLDETEVVALGGVMLWNEVLCVMPGDDVVAEKIKNKIYSEIHNHLISKHGARGVGVKMGAILSIMVDLQTAEKTINESVTVCKVFNPQLIKVWDDD